MIRILSDFNQLISPANQIVLDRVSDYPGAYQHILWLLQNQQDQIIVVHHLTILQWLKNMATRYPQGSFVFETIDARGALAHRWGMEILASVTNENPQNRAACRRLCQPKVEMSPNCQSRDVPFGKG